MSLFFFFKRRTQYNSRHNNLLNRDLKDFSRVVCVDYHWRRNNLVFKELFKAEEDQIFR